MNLLIICDIIIWILYILHNNIDFINVKNFNGVPRINIIVEMVRMFEHNTCFIVNLKILKVCKIIYTFFYVLVFCSCIP